MKKYDNSLFSGGLILRRWLVDIPPEAAATLAKQQATPVDLYGLLELAILHELTHTRNGGSTEDLPSQYVKEYGGAGWRYATSVQGDAFNNAETVAFMGLLSKLVQLGFGVYADGDLYHVLIPEKRSLFDRFHFDVNG